MCLDWITYPKFYSLRFFFTLELIWFCFRLRPNKFQNIICIVRQNTSREREREKYNPNQCDECEIFYGPLKYSMTVSRCFCERVAKNLIWFYLFSSIFWHLKRQKATHTILSLSVFQRCQIFVYRFVLWLLFGWPMSSRMLWRINNSGNFQLSEIFHPIET